MADHVRSVKVGPWVLAVLPVDIDAVSSPALGSELGSLLDGDVTVLVADMTGTGFCDSSGVRMLVLVNRHAAESGSEFRLVIPSSAVRRVLNLMGADQVLKVFGSMNEALVDAPAHVRTGQREGETEQTGPGGVLA